MVSYCNHDGILAFEGADERRLGRIVDLNDLDAGGEWATRGISSTDSNMGTFWKQSRLQEPDDPECQLLSSDELVDTNSSAILTEHMVVV